MESFVFGTMIFFWACFAGVAYAYVGYPILLWFLAHRFGRRRNPPVETREMLPRVSLLIAAHNEAAVIGDRVENALAMDYPADRLEIVVVCDGCTDTTTAIVRSFASRGVRMIERTQRSGKAAALNAAVPQLSGEIVMFSDANTSTQPDAARRLVRWFQDAHVGVVCGKLVLTDPATGRNVDGLYWKYETQLKRYEGSLGALLGANGGIYAVRRSLIAPIPEGTIVDDLVLPLQAKLRSGCAIVFDKQAIAHEETAADVRAEFRRRTRIGAGGFQSIALLAGLLDPRRGWICFTFLSHKVLRWLCPFFLIGMLAGNLVLCGEPAYSVLLAFQAAFYLAALAAAYVPGRSPLLRILRLGTMFTSMNAALLVGFWRWLRGSQKVTWQRTARLAETTSASGV